MDYDGVNSVTKAVFIRNHNPPDAPSLRLSYIYILTYIDSPPRLLPLPPTYPPTHSLTLDMAKKNAWTTVSRASTKPTPAPPSAPSPSPPPAKVEEAESIRPTASSPILTPITNSKDLRAFDHDRQRVKTATDANPSDRSLPTPSSHPSPT